MNRNRLKQVGLDRLVRLAWVDKAAMLAMAGNDVATARKLFQEDLRDNFRSGDGKVRGSAAKTITILTRIWLKVPGELENLRRDGLEIMKNGHMPCRVAMHWGMLMAVYPFWSSVAAHTGRLLRLQGTVAATHVQRRMREQYGERETVSRRARYALRSLVDWGVICETETKGVYAAGQDYTVEDARQLVWMAEAYLHTREGGAAPLPDLAASPIYFPFRIGPVNADNLAAAAPRIELIRHGTDDHVVRLRKHPALAKAPEAKDPGKPRQERPQSWRTSP